MTFSDQGKSVQLKGDPSLVRTIISSKSLIKVSEVETATMLWMMEYKGKEGEGQI